MRRNCKRTSRTMKYALYDDKIPILIDGEETFEYTVGYTAPEDFKATLSSGRSDSESTDFGTDVSYDRVISTFDKTLPVDVNSLIWVQSTPVYINGVLDPTSADYKVVAILDGLYNLRIAIKSLPKTHTTVTPTPPEPEEPTEPDDGEDDGF